MRWFGASILADLAEWRRHRGESRRERKLGTVETVWLMLYVGIDKVSLQLPETAELYKRFKSHKGNKKLGTISVEVAVLFTAFGRIPKAFSFARAYSSETSLLRPLIKRLKKYDLLLIDNGFYSLPNFQDILDQGCQFLCPCTVSCRPSVVQKLGEGDYLVTIYSAGRKGEKLKKAERMAMTVRAIYVHRKGCRNLLSRLQVRNGWKPVALPHRRELPKGVLRTVDPRLPAAHRRRRSRWPRQPRARENQL
jgi:hypothetical protein